MALEVRDEAVPKRRVRSRTKQDSAVESIDTRARTQTPRKPKRNASMAVVPEPSLSAQLPHSIPLSLMGQAMQPPLLSLDEVLPPNGASLSLDGVDAAYEGIDASPDDVEPSVSPRNTLNDLTGREWIAETKSVWFQKGLGAKHPHAQIERQHPAPYSFQDVARLIRFFTKAGGRVVDPFVGVASTLKACALTGRYGVGIELSHHWVELSRERLATEVGPEALASQEIIEGDARAVLANTQCFPDASFDFSVCSPPYWAILTKKADHKVRAERLQNGLATQYSDAVDDLGNIADYGEFLAQLGIVFGHVHRVLKPGGYACIVVGDFRHKSEYIAYHADLIRLLTSPDVPGPRYELHGITILAQNHKNLYPYGYPFAYVPNMHHQYILILRKPKQSGKSTKATRKRGKVMSPSSQESEVDGK